MPDKTFNHEVTAGLLRGWLADGPQGHPGIWFWDLKKGATAPSFEVGKRAKFAGHDFLYVGDNDGVPISTELEDQLAKHEHLLVNLCAKLWTGAATQADIDRLGPTALPAIVTAAMRSAWSTGRVSQWLNLDEPAGLEFLADSFRTVIMGFRGWDFVFMQDSERPLLIGDAPFMDFRVIGASSAEGPSDVCAMPLGRHAAIVGFKSERPVPSASACPHRLGEAIDPGLFSITVRLGPGKMNANMANLSNQYTLHRSRNWVAAGSDSELQAHAEFLQPAALQQRVATDTVVIQSSLGSLLHRRELS